MQSSQTVSEEKLSCVIEQLPSELTWQWEEKNGVLLTKFARDKKESILAELQGIFPHQWNKKSTATIPSELKEQLGEFKVIAKEQLIFSIPSSDNSPAISAIWWPWGHGGTYSLRLLYLAQNYCYQAKPKISFWQKVKAAF